MFMGTVRFWEAGRHRVAHCRVDVRNMIGEQGPVLIAIG